MADFKQQPEATEPGVGKRRTQLSFVSRYSQLQPSTGLEEIDRKNAMHQEACIVHTEDDTGLNKGRSHRQGGEKAARLRRMSNE